jgi:hypothetical protein
MLAKRGETKVGKCVFKSLQNVADGNKMTVMSETSGCKNRNVDIADLLVDSVRILGIPFINQGFYFN